MRMRRAGLGDWFVYMWLYANGHINLTLFSQISRIYKVRENEKFGDQCSTHVGLVYVHSFSAKLLLAIRKKNGSEQRRGFAAGTPLPPHY